MGTVSFYCVVGCLRLRGQSDPGWSNRYESYQKCYIRFNLQI